MRLWLLLAQEPEGSECELGLNGRGDNLLFRLFVGWVPKLFTEQDLLPLFQKVGGSGRKSAQGLRGSGCLLVTNRPPHAPNTACSLAPCATPSSSKTR
jgi:hypothetical protein